MFTEESIRVYIFFPTDTVGLTVGICVGVFGIMAVGIPIMVVAIILANKRCDPQFQTRLAATTPATGATEMMLNQEIPITNYTPVHVQQEYPPQPVYKDAEFSSQDAPPSYDAALAIPSCTTQQPLLVHILIEPPGSDNYCYLSVIMSTFVD